jgi:N6-adenosine-specific RNA methylase IME4
MNLNIDQELKDLIPKLSQDEYRLLEESILNEGCRDAIITWNDTIIDGHNRYEICSKHRIPFKTEDRDFESKDKVKEWMIINQFGRRNISNYHRCELALKLEAIIKTKAKEKEHMRKTTSQNSDKSFPIIDTKKELAKIAQVSHDTIAKVKVIQEQAPEEIKQKLEAGTVSINEAYKEIKRQEVIEKQQVKFEELKQKEILPTTGRYDVIVIDPPWKMEKIKRDVAIEQVGFDYPTMTIDEIKEFDIPAEDDCHVFMWITHKHLPSGFEIFDSWGVKYVFTMVWHKNGGFQPFGLPQYNCEFVLYGKIGNPQFADLKAFNTCFKADRTHHSAKPDEFYELIRRVTAGKRIDIFNRRDIEGFDKWGNEA